MSEEGVREISGNCGRERSYRAGVVLHAILYHVVSSCQGTFLFGFGNAGKRRFGWSYRGFNARSLTNSRVQDQEGPPLHEPNTQEWGTRSAARRFTDEGRGIGLESGDYARMSHLDKSVSLTSSFRP